MPQINRKDIIIGSLKYAAGATAGFLLANFFVVEEGPETRDMAIGALIAFPVSYAFFFLVFTFVGRSNKQD